MHPRRYPSLVLPAVLASMLLSTLSAQNPLLAEVGEAIPDGFGQLIGSADYEGDGDADLFSTTGVYLNEGGFFVPGPRLPAAFDPWSGVGSIAIADFNGDGRQDLVYSRTSGSPAGLVLLAAPGAGGAAFVASSVVVGGSQFSEMTAADVDADGDVDLVVASSQSATGWRLLRNDGLGNFTFAPAAQWPLGLSTQTYWVAAGDFNGDGFPDMFATTTAGSFWRNNLGGAGFSASLLLPPSFAGERGCVGDFNGDGFDDVFIGDYTGAEAIYVGSLNGLVLGSLTVGSIMSGTPIAADRDGDGFDELIRNVAEVSGAQVGELFVLPGQASGPGTPVSLGLIRYAYTNGTPFPGVAVLDVDGDGDLDTVVASGGMSPYILLRNANGGETFAPKIIPPQLEGLYLPPRDVDGDGDIDLMTTTWANSQIQLQLWRNDGRGDFATTPVSAGTISAPLAYAPTWVDLDGDGDDDIWINTLHASAPAMVMLNNGSGVFTLGTTVPNIGRVQAQVAADFNGDSIVDVVVGRPAVSVFPVVLAYPLLIAGQAVPGGVAFAPPLTVGVAAPIIDMVVVDPDQDGDKDILVAAAGGFMVTAAVFVMENDGLGNFTALPAFVGVQATALAAGDLNFDGIDDVVIGGQTWLGNGTTYTAHGVHAAPLGNISLADLDDDGILDLFDQVGRWYPGDGLGNFGVPIEFVPYTPAAGLPSGGGHVPMDLDGDGDLDTISPNASAAGHLSLYANLTRHAAPTSLATPGQPLGIDVYGKSNELWFLGLSLPPSGGIALPGFGTLLLDPTNMLVWSAGTLSPSGRAHASIVIPPNGAGFTYSWQALVGQPLRFTNGFDTPIAF